MRETYRYGMRLFPEFASASRYAEKALLADMRRFRLLSFFGNLVLSPSGCSVRCAPCSPSILAATSSNVSLRRKIGCELRPARTPIRESKFSCALRERATARSFSSMRARDFGLLWTRMRVATQAARCWR